MDQYAEVIGNDASIDDYFRMASYFTNQNAFYKAGEFFFKAEMYDKVCKSTCLLYSMYYLYYVKDYELSHYIAY